MVLLLFLDFLSINLSAKKYMICLWLIILYFMKFFYN